MRTSFEVAGLFNHQAWTPQPSWILKRSLHRSKILSLLFSRTCACIEGMHPETLTKQAYSNLMQDASKSLEQLEALRGTLQPEAGIHMYCTERGKRKE